VKTFGILLIQLLIISIPNTDNGAVRGAGVSIRGWPGRGVLELDLISVESCHQIIASSEALAARAVTRMRAGQDYRRNLCRGAASKRDRAKACSYI